MADPAHRPHVIADRYLTSPAALAAQPFGPVDALDTQSGRGAQVRIVFVAGEWDEGDLAAAVARWCAIGCSEVCGVLDFGRHDGRWFLVLPRTLGLPVERWRALRRPAAADAVRLVRACGVLADHVAAAGFAPDAATLADVAVGPGPTPFLERPLLPSPGGGGAVPAGSGQRILVAVCEAALGAASPPPELAAWTARAREGGFDTLAECLADLDRCALPAEADAETDPPGVERLFDEAFDLDGPGVRTTRERRLHPVTGILLVLLGIAAALLVSGRGTPSGAAAGGPATSAASAAPTGPIPIASTGPARSSRPARHRAARTHAAHHRHPAARHRARHRRHPHVHPAHAASTPAAPTARVGSTASPTPPTSTAVSTTTTPGSGATTLPAPGGTTLPTP